MWIAPVSWQSAHRTKQRGQWHVPPFGHATALATYMDTDLLQYDVVWAAAGTPRAVFPIDPKQLQEALAAPTIAVG